MFSSNLIPSTTKISWYDLFLVVKDFSVYLIYNFHWSGKETEYPNTVREIFEITKRLK